MEGKGETVEDSRAKLEKVEAEVKTAEDSWAKVETADLEGCLAEDERVEGSIVVVETGGSSLSNSSE